MNDDELIMVLREQRGNVPMTVPMEEIISRGRAVRARRRVPGVTAAAGTAVAAAVAVSVALPASHPAAGHPAAGHPAGGPGVQLTAWTVTRQADGTLKVTFREATDAAGLQRTLRADGVPASVTFTGQRNPACQPYTSSGPAFKPFGSKTGPLGGDSRNPQDAYNSPYALVIDPAALPKGAGLQIWTSGSPGAADNFQLDVSLVRVSRR
jgi:hypothetical protein